MQRLTKVTEARTLDRGRVLLSILEFLSGVLGEGELVSARPGPRLPVETRRPGCIARIGPVLPPLTSWRLNRAPRHAAGPPCQLQILAPWFSTEFKHAFQCDDPFRWRIRYFIFAIYLLKGQAQAKPSSPILRTWAHVNRSFHSSISSSSRATVRSPYAPGFGFCRPQQDWNDVSLIRLPVASEALDRLEYCWD